MKAVALALWIVVCMSACTEYSERAHDGLYGTWLWKQSSGGLTGHQVMTPQTVGYAKVIEFSSEGVFREYHDDSLVVSASYVVARRETIFGDDHDVISFVDPTGQLMDQVIMILTESQLDLADPCVDCFGHTYVRTER
jgi:hypothetical protein